MMQHQSNLSGLDLESSYSIGEAAFAAVVEIFARRRPSVIVEFGSGLSTVRLSDSFPSSDILSIENNEWYRDRTVSLLREFDLHSRTQVWLRPLVWRRFGLGLALSYSKGPFPEQIDCVLIDGPSGSAYRGREACLYQIFPRVRIGGVIILDDCFRAGEKKAVANWLKVYKDAFSMRQVDLGHGLAVLEKIRETKPYWLWFSPLPLRTALRSCYWYLFHSSKRRP